MSAGVCSFTTNDAFMKSLAGDMTMFQAVFLRGIIGTVILVAVAMAMGQLQFRMSARDGWMVLIRSIGEVAAAYFFITALFHMPMANASAIMQALPLTVTLAGAVFLGEAVGWRRLSAILVGFLGVMLIIRPGADGFTIYSLYVVAAVISVTIRDIAARSVSEGTSSMTVAVALAARDGAVAVAALPAATCALVFVRTVGEVATRYFFITALFHMPMANASAIMQALPLTVTLAGAVFLGEKVGWRCGFRRSWSASWA